MRQNFKSRQMQKPGRKLRQKKENGQRFPRRYSWFWIKAMTFWRRFAAATMPFQEKKSPGRISRMELIVQKIFERAKAHPEIIPDLNRLMDYYLPMTVKLLNAYEDMDSQPIQGENIASSKKEIEDTIDTLNVAFEKLLDSVFEDTAIDVSSDISVLNTVLAQEGLTEDELTRMRREAKEKA